MFTLMGGLFVQSRAIDQGNLKVSNILATSYSLVGIGNVCEFVWSPCRNNAQAKVKTSGCF